MARFTKSDLIEIKPNRQARPRSAKWARAKIGLCALFGLWAAVFWHVIHLADEPYLASFDNIHFWLHLLFEGFLAVYAAGLLYVIWNSLTRLRG